MPTTAASALRDRSMLLLGAAVTLALALLPPAAASAQDTPEGPVFASRIGGADRFDTAANVSALTFPAAEVAHLVTGHDFPDALAGVSAATAAGGPLLLSARGQVPGRTLEELDRLGVREVVLVGGQGVLSTGVRAQLEEAGYATSRIAGADRYATAAAVALASGGAQVGSVDGQRTAVLASGERFADALAVGPVTGALGLPLLLTPSRAPAPAVTSALDALDVERLLVVGGGAAVGEEVVGFYAERGYAVERLAGPERTATAAAVARAAVDRFGFSASRVLLARGDGYADALSAGLHGALMRAPLLLSATPDRLSTPTGDWLTSACPDTAMIRVVGGGAAVAPTTLEDARTLAASCDTEAWTNCTNPVAPYSIGYPEDWTTNAAPIDELPPCSMFDPDPGRIRAEGMHVPADLAVLVRAHEVAYDEVTGAGPFEEAVTRTEVRLAGRRAERLEVRSTEDGFLPAGTLSTRWTIDLGDGTILVAVSHDVGEPAYEEKLRVLDQMVVTARYGG